MKFKRKISKSRLIICLPTTYFRDNPVSASLKRVYKQIFPKLRQASPRQPCLGLIKTHLFKKLFVIEKGYNSLILNTVQNR